MLLDPNYIAIKQRNTCLNWEMRLLLILWLVKVYSRFSLQHKTLFLAINYINRFLSLKEVSNNRLLLIGTVALSIAVKYEDREVVTIKSL
jgi:hypothetical protein